MYYPVHYPYLPKHKQQRLSLGLLDRCEHLLRLDQLRGVRFDDVCLLGAFLSISSSTKILQQTRKTYHDALEFDDTRLEPFLRIRDHLLRLCDHLGLQSANHTISFSLSLSASQTKGKEPLKNERKGHTAFLTNHSSCVPSSSNFARFAMSSFTSWL